MAFRWRAEGDPTLNTGWKALWFSRGSGAVFLRKPLILWFSRDPSYHPPDLDPRLILQFFFGWTGKAYKYMYMKSELKASLKQNTLLIRLAVLVNRTYNRTNRGLIRVTLRPWKPCMIFKTFEKLIRVTCPCIIVLAIVHYRERPCETVRDRM